MIHNIDYSKIEFPPLLNVTEQHIDISSLTKNQKQYYIELFKECIEIYKTKSKSRVIIGLAGPAGSGKSVIGAIFKEIAKQLPLPLPFQFETIGIDAFHFPNDYLLTHYIDDKPLKNHKGRFDTYDVPKLTKVLTEFTLGNEVSFPSYSRKIHDPIENTTTIHKSTPTLLLLEGLWILSDEGEWKNVHKLLDFSFFIHTEKEKVRQGVLERHISGGKTAEEASDYFERNEAINFEYILQTKSSANKQIPPYYDVV